MVGRAWLFETDWPPLVRARASAHVPLPSIVRQFAWHLSASDEVAAVALRSLAGGEVLGVGRA